MTTNHKDDGGSVIEMTNFLEICGNATKGPWMYRAKSNSWHHPPDPGTGYSFGPSIMDEDNELKFEDILFVETFHPATVKSLLEEVGRLRAAHDAVLSLIDNSHGVYGLHLNGHPSPWSELRAGGRFETWLLAFDEAIAARHATQGD